MRCKDCEHYGEEIDCPYDCDEDDEICEEFDEKN